ncbi:hypothetical protein D3C81_1897370 [compost metagenome]
MQPTIGIQGIERLGLAHQLTPVPVDNQVQRGAIQERTRMLDLFAASTLQDPQISIVSDVLRRLTATQACRQKAHQFTIVMFHEGT